jgi:hypothetical protein
MFMGGEVFSVVVSAWAVQTWRIGKKKAIMNGIYEAPNYGGMR